MGGIWTTEIAVILTFLAVGLALPVWAIVDALRASEAQWDAVGQSRLVWVAVILVGAVCGGFFGVVLAAVYLLTVRPKLAAAVSY